ncbi:flavin-containing polyamine oxidase [Gloeophyllum trabeum ATCC 11539]|uniref:Amine oxidase n=1 Tax=Gloeophyllum trabeum (strain ATCC 11539 / FP-39264 / Madison 617) TaxID=670483 RepID=S7RCV5_GLOTA|nr:flavin-containing polyamine oxidase [Gloeophyllum trabeum ATCC 11539]EPQ50239.1 flavin-containing polyamine oxidase [Gloeophyllum trabeum ATCC 11539]
MGGPTVALLLLSAAVVAVSAQACRETKVAVLGAGLTGIEAAKSLSEANIKDFLILEYNDEIGGRVKHTTFGKNAEGNPYTIELGANWVQGLGTPGGPQNPIWILAQRYNLTNTYSDYSSIETFSTTGATNFTELLDEFEDAYAYVEQDAGYILTEGLQDRSFRSGLSLGGWKPMHDAAKQAVEWWEFDWEYAFSPDQSSQEFAIVNYNTTFYQFSDGNNYVFDQRGFNIFIKGEASTYLTPNDSRLLLNTVVTNIAYNDSKVRIDNADGSCITADYAICTFSLGVLQNDDVSFTPPLPLWKQQGITTFDMGTYTKIFLQFPTNQVFWDTSYQFLLYADPTTRGYYPVWQSLDAEGFLPGSGILFVTVVDDQSYRVEAQSDEQTLAEVMAVLRTMYPNTTIPEPTAFYYPRWTQEPWARGSYSNWPPGTTLQMHQNLRANVGRVWFAGEHTSPEYFGFLQAAYMEGQEVGQAVARCVLGQCVPEVHYEDLRGTTQPGDYNPANGWTVSSFLTYGFD